MWQWNCNIETEAWEWWIRDRNRYHSIRLHQAHTKILDLGEGIDQRGGNGHQKHLPSFSKHQMKREWLINSNPTVGWLGRRGVLNFGGKWDLRWWRPATYFNWQEFIGYLVIDDFPENSSDPAIDVLPFFLDPRHSQNKNNKNYRTMTLQTFMANLLQENSVQDIRIVRDDASQDSSQRSLSLPVLVYNQRMLLERFESQHYEKTMAPPKIPERRPSLVKLSFWVKHSANMIELCEDVFSW